MQIDPPVWALCLFVLPFSFAIAVLKDVPDIEGDRRVQHPHVHGPARRPSGCSSIGLAALAIAYAGMIFVGAVRCSQITRSPWFWSVGHLARRRRCSGTGRGSADPRDRTGFTRFYMRVWALFFLEYLLVPIACLAT